MPTVPQRIADDPRSTEQLASDVFFGLVTAGAEVNPARVARPWCARRARHGHRARADRPHRARSPAARAGARLDRDRRAARLHAGHRPGRVRRSTGNRSTWAASTDSSPRVSGSHWPSATAAASGPDATDHPPGAKRTTSSTGRATAAAPTWPTASCSANITTCCCTTITGRSNDAGRRVGVLVDSATGPSGSGAATTREPKSRLGGSAGRIAGSRWGRAGGLAAVSRPVAPRRRAP